MLTYTRAPISTSLLRLPADLTAVATAMFKAVLRYTGDLDLVNDNERDVLAHQIIAQAMQQPMFVDELYLQLLKQTRRNGSPESLTRAWELTAAVAAAGERARQHPPGATAAAPPLPIGRLYSSSSSLALSSPFTPQAPSSAAVGPSKEIRSPLVSSHLHKAAKDTRTPEACQRLAQKALNLLSKTCKNPIPRMKVPSVEEIRALRSGGHRRDMALQAAAAGSPLPRRPCPVLPCHAMPCVLRGAFRCQACFASLLTFAPPIPCSQGLHGLLCGR